eukprot:scaffold76021_cov62-Phaeocystis_antarctica.AAC.3
MGGRAIGGDARKAARAPCREQLERGRGLGYVPVQASVEEKDLKVGLQAGMRLHHGCDQGKPLMYPLAKLGLIRCVCDEAFDGLSREKPAFQQHALGV